MPVRTASTFEETVERLGSAIRAGLLVPGAKLPPERELARQLRISRSTLRQALTVADGAIAIAMQAEHDDDAARRLAPWVVAISLNEMSAAKSADIRIPGFIFFRLLNGRAS